MDITIEKIHDTDASKLFKFELENREYFEEMVPSRGDEYYNFESFLTRHKAIVAEQTQGLSYFYLIKDKRGSILGRINLVDIDKCKNQGHIGYRVGKKYIGKGIANKALKLLLETMRKQGIERILAKTTNTNIASQRILEKNGFKHVETSDEEYEMNREKFNFFYYTWTRALRRGADGDENDKTIL